VAPLLSMTYPQFYVSERSQADVDADKARKANYALAWGLTYYLRKGILPERNSPYAHILDRFCEELWKTKDPKGATAAAFEGISTSELSDDLARFWSSRNKRSAAGRKKLFNAAASAPRR
jgi:hypothetical protein